MLLANLYSMRLSELQVKVFCQNLLLALRSKQLVELLKPDVEVLKRMQSIVHGNMKAEQDIDREAEKMMKQYEAKMGTQIDREKMFSLIKKQIMKDRKIDFK